MKKTAFLLVFLLVLLCPVFMAAEEDPDSCICGRPYYTEDSGSHQKYDCVECGEKISNCTCKTCWCGADISVTSDGTQICSVCEKDCYDCVCADRETMLAIENERRSGRVSLGETPKPDTVISALLFFLCAGALSVFYFLYSFRERRRIIAEQAAEEEKLKEERRRIMLKIEAEQNGGKTLKQKKKEARVAGHALHWEISETPLGTVLYELVNAARFLQHRGKYTAPSLRYILCRAQDENAAHSRAAKGEFGETVADAVNVIDFYDNELYEYIKSEYGRMMPHLAENELVHLTNAACNFDISASAAMPVLKNFADTSLAAFDEGVREPSAPVRFEDTTKKEGEEE